MFFVLDYSVYWRNTTLSERTRCCRSLRHPGTETPVPSSFCRTPRVSTTHLSHPHVISDGHRSVLRSSRGDRGAVGDCLDVSSWSSSVRRSWVKVVGVHPWIQMGKTLDSGRLVLPVRDPGDGNEGRLVLWGITGTKITSLSRPGPDVPRQSFEDPRGSHGGRLL